MNRINLGGILRVIKSLLKSVVLIALWSSQASFATNNGKLMESLEVMKVHITEVECKLSTDGFQGLVTVTSPSLGGDSFAAVVSYLELPIYSQDLCNSLISGKANGELSLLVSREEATPYDKYFLYALLGENTAILNK